MNYWLNGEFVTTDKAINIRDRGLLLGDGVFETLLVDKGQPAFLRLHLDRMEKGLAALKIKIDMPKNIDCIIAELARLNDMGEADIAARITVTRGASGRGLLFPSADVFEPTMFITLAPLPGRNGGKPMELVYSQYRRCTESIAAKHKTLNYLDNVLARNEANGAGADEAIMLNSGGRIACASAANVFCITPDDVILTPPAREGALRGVIRDLLLAEATKSGFDIREEVVRPEQLTGYDLFLTSSLLGVRAAVLLETAAASARVQSSIFNRLQAWYLERLQNETAGRLIS